MTTVIPPSWSQTTLNVVSDLTTGGTPSTKEPGFYGGSLPFVKPGDLDSLLPITSASQYLTEAGAEKSRIIRKGASLVSCIGSLGKVGYAGRNVATNQQINSVEFNNSIIDEKFGYYQCRTLKQWMERESSATTIAILNKKKFGEAPFFVAPLKEQRRIADKLDTVLARVDAVQTRLAHVAPLLKRFRQSVFAAATSGRLTEDWRGGGGIDWTLIRADEVCAKVQSGGTPKEGFFEAGIPFLKVYNIVDQKINFSYKPQYISEQAHNGSMRKSNVQPGDVLMNIVGPPLGKVAIVPDIYSSWNINQAITLFRPSDKVTTQWLYVVLCDGAPIQDVMKHTKGSVGQVNISLSQCRAFEIPVPSQEEQTEIVRRVETLFAFADRFESRLQSAQTAANRLTPALLAKAFRGELVSQDPSDEPATELLRRLREPRAAAAHIKRKAAL